MTAIFSTGFDRFVCAGDTIEAERDGFTIRAAIHDDDDTTPPWEREDGHGEVTGWTRRAKEPGELVLSEDRDSKRFYDFAGACRKALAEGWRNREDARAVEAGEPVKRSAREVASRAAREDFETLRAWCRDDWHYCGVVVTVEREGVELASESLWGVERNYPGSDNAYLTETAGELAETALEAARETIARLAETISK